MALVVTSPRVVVTDDSTLMRRVLADGLAELGLTVVGQAGSGEEALSLCERLAPDVLTLDLAMPGMDGVAVLRALRASRSPIPVVVVSSFTNGARAVEALAEGAVELVAKPEPGDSLPQFLRDLAGKLRIAAAARVDRTVGRAGTAANGHRARWGGGRPGAQRATKRAVVIACSTGGPKALADVVPKLPAQVGEGMLIVQHMPAGFTASLAERLDRMSAIRVSEARDGLALDPGAAYLAPGGAHLRLTPAKRTSISSEEPIGGLRPRADLTIRDSAAAYGERLLLVVLTGMGSDGVEGAAEVKRRGGRVICEAESSCVVYGMPRAVVEAGLADLVVPLCEMSEAIAGEAGS